ncbi:GntR family transcriptional regulator [Kitasatospora sp. NPDC056138]|uniref:GntR family transcriptional regulator n=1 Tax=Kitasatospora sp. NPDC056138 TaxID=3345724 RepID=UPI0035E24FCB
MPNSFDSGGGHPAIQRNSLREQIAGALREEMMAGRLAAGRNFTVKEIAEQYGVSATPAREALVDLAAQGLLRAEHHRGFTVPEFTWADFLEIFEARTLLTDSSLRQLAAGRGGPGVPGPDWTRLPSLRRRAEAAVRASQAGQLDVLVGCDRRFWQEVGLLVGNRRIGDYLDWLRVQSWMFAAPHLRAADNLSGVCWAGHIGLVDRIEARDLAGTHRLVNEYNLFTVELLASLTGQPLESVGVLPLLREHLSVDAPPTPSPAPSQGGPGGQPAPPETREVAEVGLGLVPLPRFVPPGGAPQAGGWGRFGRPVRTSRPGNEEPAPGR